MISDLNDGAAVATFLEGVNSHYCLTTLEKVAPKTMSDLRVELDK